MKGSIKILTERVVTYVAIYFWISIKNNDLQLSSENPMNCFNKISGFQNIKFHYFVLWDGDIEIARIKYEIFV